LEELTSRKKKKKLVKVSEECKNFLRWLDPKEPPKMNMVNRKVISFSQLKEHIEELYEAKRDFDEKCKKNGLPRESMEQFMFSFFKHKFGLNTIVIEWVYAMVESIRMYHHEDNDIALFALILRNEVDEEFAEIQKQIKLTINDILINLIETRNPNKGKREVNSILSKKVKGRVSEQVGLEIVNTMYTDEHPNKDEILEKLLKKIQDDEAKIKEGSLALSKSFANLRAKPKSGVQQVRVRSIKYSDLVKIILDMQLKTHYSFLSNLSTHFKTLDAQNYGYISIERFQNLVGIFKPELANQQEISEMMKNRESYDPKTLTFSDVVILFSAKQVESEGETITMLQYIFEMGPQEPEANGHESFED
jgi:hypothetical protein